MKIKHYLQVVTSTLMSCVCKGTGFSATSFGMQQSLLSMVLVKALSLRLKLRLVR